MASYSLMKNADGGTGTDLFPTSLHTVGLVSLGVDVFIPGFAKALALQMRRLGQWRGKAVWILHFEQKNNMKSSAAMADETKTIEVPLKGRVWVAASSYNVCTWNPICAKPMKELELMRDHLAIDMGR